MRPDENIIAEMTPLLEALCEDRLAPDQTARLEQCVLSSVDARWYYLQYLDLHGSLYWNAAGVGSAEALSSEEMPVCLQSVSGSAASQSVSIRPTSQWMDRRKIMIGWALTACASLTLVVGWSLGKFQPVAIDVAQHVPADQTPTDAPKQGLSGEKPVPPLPRREIGPPVALSTNANSPQTLSGGHRVTTNPTIPAPPEPHHEDLDSREVIAAINSDIRSRWETSGVRPSAKADDSEWIRRVFLDLLGRIPTVDETESFLANKRSSKRSEMIDNLLDSTEFARNLTTVWTNVLIGRKSEQRVNRPAFQKFLRTSFASNRPWNQIVYDLVAAEGNNVEHGATNFLIAHLNNDALPATAVTARVFLGEQLQCNQCHNNPFSKSSQNAFWEMHSFFAQTACVPRQAIDPKNGQAKYSYTELVTNTAGGPTFFETQNGVMRVAFPKFNGQAIDTSPETNRRATLARLMTEGDQPQLASAYVNRLWEHFFGRGFTPSADDIGPHTPTSHPELLDLLARQFVRSGYDTKQLVRWICNSDSYQLTSRFGADNRQDDPIEGQPPMFSRMYVKSMTPEQVYDSFVIATKAHLAGGVDWEQAELQRQHWLSQFVVDYNTDENEEAMELDGNLVQALTLMNGKLVDKALEISPGTYLEEVIRRRGDDKEKIREMCLAVLSRPPTATELTKMRKLVHQDSTQIAAHGASPQVAIADGYQDLFWALLNSNEFSVVH